MAGNSKNKRRSAGKRNNVLTNTPVVFGNSALENEQRKNQPYVDLHYFREGRGQPTSWVNLFFRICTGYELACIYYKEDTQRGLAEALWALRNIDHRFVNREFEQYDATDEEIISLLAGLEATDAIQDSTTRRQQLPVELSVRARMELAVKRNMSPMPDLTHFFPLTEEELKEIENAGSRISSIQSA